MHDSRILIFPSKDSLFYILLAQIYVKTFLTHIRRSRCKVSDESHRQTRCELNYNVVAKGLIS